MRCPYRKRTTAWKHKDTTDYLEEFPNCTGEDCPFYCMKGKEEKCDRAIHDMGIIMRFAEE